MLATPIGVFTSERFTSRGEPLLMMSGRCGNLLQHRRILCEKTPD